MRAAVLSLLLVLAVPVRAEDLWKVAWDHATTFRTAVLKQDSTWYARFAAPDFHEIDARGKRMNLSQTIAHAKETYTLGRVSAMKINVVKVAPQGTGMIVTLEYDKTTETSFKDRKRPIVLSTATRYVETWSKVGGVWKLRELKTLKTSSKIKK